MDCFLASPMMQPKLEVANYVASEGIAVPGTYGSFDEAMEAVEAGETVIARSEHPQDYDGASGLLRSFVVTPEQLAMVRAEGAKYSDDAGLAIQHWIEGLDARTLEIDLAKAGGKRIPRFCELQQIGERAFLDQVSFTYWKHLGGYNQTIVADSAVRGRYHIFSASPDAGVIGDCNYTIVEQGIARTMMNAGVGVDEQLFIDGAAELVRFYESVRNLPRFDSNHCPIVECQWFNGARYFLQYLRTRDFDEPGFRVEREARPGEIESLFVRGATPPEGMLLNAALYYPDGQMPMAQEDASFDFLADAPFAEIMARRRDAYFRDERSLDSLMKYVATGHVFRSQQFKPRVSVTANFSGMLTGEFLSSAFEAVMEGGEPYRIPIWLLSDGRRAFVKILK